MVTAMISPVYSLSKKCLWVCKYTLTRGREARKGINKIILVSAEDHTNLVSVRFTQVGKDQGLLRPCRHLSTTGHQLKQQGTHCLMQQLCAPLYERDHVPCMVNSNWARRVHTAVCGVLSSSLVECRTETWFKVPFSPSLKVVTKLKRFLDC